MMNSGLATIVASVNNSISNTITINTTQLNTGMMSDGMSDPSSPESTFDTSDIIMGDAIGDDVTSQLAASGPVGIAAAAAINSAKKKRRHHLFETNPAVRKRQQTRLLRKLKATIEEYTTRVGQQAVILCCTPGKSASMTNSYKVFGSQPLENVVKNCKGVIMQDLETALAEQTPSNLENSGVYDLPTLTLDGIPTPIDKMTQAQLRTFIPEMLKYSTGRSKPGWGKPEYRPIWWPNDLPWANVRSDVRTEQEKKAVSWTEALRSIVRNCYRHHGREDLLHIFGDDGSLAADTQTGPYTGTMVQTINNPDGTVSIIQIDTGPNSVVTLPDGTQATVVHSMTALPQEAAQLVQQQQQDGGQAVQTLAEVAQTSQTDTGGVTVTPVSIEINEASHTLATLNGGRLMLTGDTTALSTDGSGIMAIPVSMYQDIVASQDKAIVASSTDSFPLSSAQLAMTSIQQHNDLDQQQVTLQGGYHPDTLDTQAMSVQTNSLESQNIVAVQTNGIDSQNITVQGVPIETKSEPE